MCRVQAVSVPQHSPLVPRTRSVSARRAKQVVELLVDAGEPLTTFGFCVPFERPKKKVSSVNEGT